jgi:fibronectin type 3 domain-containing protein
MDMIMKKHLRVLLALFLSFCCLFSSIPASAGSLTSALKSSVEDALATSQNAKEIYSFLINTMGLNSAAACGVLANIRRESYFNPTSYGDNGTSYGICQWHDTSTGTGRFTNLINWCAANGYDYTSLDGQLHFLQYELSQNNSKILYNGQTIYGALLAIPNSAEGAYNAGYYWCNYFEVPFSNDPARRAAECEARGALARDTYWLVYSEPVLEDAVTVAGGLQVNWETFDGAIQYELYRYVNGDSSTIALIAETTDTFVVDTTVESGNTYTYILCAVMLQADGTTYTVNAKETTQFYLAPPTITNCTASSTGVKLSWSESAGATQYIIYRSDDDSDYTPIAAVDTPSYKDTTAVTSGVHYSYQVCACRDDGTGSPLYSLVSNTISNYTLDQPVITSITATQSGIKLKWDKVAKAKYYSICRSISGGEYEEIATVTKKSFTDTDAPNNATVKYKIYAYYTGSDGQTSKSKGSAVSKIYYLKTPTLKSVSSNVSKTITPKWSRNKNATGYEIQYSKSKTFKSKVTTLRIVTNDTVSWKISGLKKGTTYYVRVRAYVTKKGSKSYSAWSSTLSCKSK